MFKKATWFKVTFLVILPSLAAAQISVADSHKRLPKEERAVSNFDLGVNKITYLHTRFPKLNGEGLAVSVKELGMDSTDIDFRGRHMPSGISASLVSNHATTMATIIAGEGNSFYTGKGVAWMSELSSSSYFNLFPDDPLYFQSSFITVQNHSYGLEIENFYGAEAEAYDRQVYDYPEMSHIFSAGNNGAGTSSEGPFAGVDGYANLTGTMKMAKNVLTVGAVDSFYRVEERSSRGPAFDGRVKPELVAFGQDGSSGAAAITSGVVLLLQQAYRDRHHGELPPAALIRAVLLNSADDFGAPGPDFVHGYGNVDAPGAVRTIKEERFLQGNIGKDKMMSFQILVPDSANDLKITLAWTDPPAAVNAGRALVNDLDLSLTRPGSGDEWAPWVLNAAPSLDSLILPARRGVDRLNTQEQITLKKPEAGMYLITVNGHNIPKGPQDFSIAFEYEPANRFEWIFPTRSDNVRPVENLPVRWESTLSGVTGKIEYMLDGGDEWILIDEQVDLSQSYLRWGAPDTLALARLRMTAGDLVVLSDTFTISRPVEMKVDFNCENELFLSWNALEGARDYQLFSMNPDHLEPVMTLADTFVVLNKARFPSEYFAVAPVINQGRTGMRGRTIKVGFQNAGCYIRSFFATLQGDHAVLKLTLGSLYEVESVFFQKRVGDNFVSLASLPVDTDLEYQFLDMDLEDANNYYRAGLKLRDGTEIYSEVRSVYFLKDKAYVFYPNPVPSGRNVTILSKDLKGAFVYLYDALGRLVLKYDLLTNLETIPTHNLTSGIYFYQILLKGEKVGMGKIMVF